MTVRGLRIERVFRDHTDFLTYEDDSLISRFQFPKAIILTSNHEWDESNGKLGVRNVRHICVSGL